MKLQQHEHLEIINYLRRPSTSGTNKQHMLLIQVIKEQICTATDGVSDIIRNNWIIFYKTVPQTQW